MFSGVKVQDDWSGNPEQESVTNSGAVSAEELTGVTETSIVPDVPGVSVNVAGATETPNVGVALGLAVGLSRYPEKRTLVARVALVNRAQRMLARGERDGQIGLALGVECRAGQILAPIADHDRTARGLAVFPGYGYGNKSLRAAG